MIRFSCHCSHEFLVDEDQAGGLIQCPKCSRLNDIPALSDVQNLEDGGIYKLDTDVGAPKQIEIPAATRAFTRDLRDERGDDIDMRASVDEFLATGSEEVPLELAEEIRPGAPKYDPLTGELVEPIDIKPSNKPGALDPKSIPIAKRAVHYAGGDLHRRVTPLGILTALFQPMNLFVMMFVVLAHALFEVVLLIMVAGIFFIIPVLAIVGFLIIAHYGTIIDEMGPSEGDELPRPLRNASWSDDMWGPFIRTMAAVFLCFWPILFVSSRLSGPAGTGLLVALTLSGLFFFPAVLLTTQTAGTYLNLRPDRVIGVIKACGHGYWVSVLAFGITAPIYLGSVVGVIASIATLFKPGPMSMTMVALGMTSLALIAGIYLMHFTCWHLGMLYRANYPRFPWILQRHVYSRRTDTLAQLEQARLAARHMAALQKSRPDRAQRIDEIRAAEKAKKVQAPSPDARQIWDRVAETRNE
jgi:hypothetical protein